MQDYFKIGPVVFELEAFKVYYSHCYYISKFWLWTYWTDFDEIFLWYPYYTNPYYTNSLDGIIFKTVATVTADFVWKSGHSRILDICG